MKILGVVKFAVKNRSLKFTKIKTLGQNNKCYSMGKIRHMIGPIIMIIILNSVKALSGCVSPT